ncbi:MAG: Holliday junction resolvase-like protein [Nitrososphaerota archaeon]
MIVRNTSLSTMDTTLSAYSELFNKWKEKGEECAREDVTKKSMYTILGEVEEHLAPTIIFSKY